MRTASGRTVVTQATEDAERLLMATFVDLTLSATRQAWGRHLRVLPRAMKAYDPIAVRQESCYLRMVSIVEAYVDVISSDILRVEYARSSSLTQSLIEAAEVNFTRGWPDREKAFNDHFGIRLTKLPTHKDLKCATDVRNAIAHGVGQLTPRQRTAATRARMASIGVTVRDNYVVLDAGSVRTCRDVSMAFMRELDAQL
jgi:hypothetical protein